MNDDIFEGFVNFIERLQLIVIIRPLTPVFITECAMKKRGLMIHRKMHRTVFNIA